MLCTQFISIQWLFIQRIIFVLMRINRGDINWHFYQIISINIFYSCWLIHTWILDMIYNVVLIWLQRTYVYDLYCLNSLSFGKFLAKNLSHSCKKTRNSTERQLAISKIILRFVTSLFTVDVFSLCVYSFFACSHIQYHNQITFIALSTYIGSNMHKQPIDGAQQYVIHHRHSMDPICTNNQSHLSKQYMVMDRYWWDGDDESVGIRNNTNVGDEKEEYMAVYIKQNIHDTNWTHINGKKEVTKSGHCF